MADPRVTIIILTWNHWELTAVCLRSLQNLTYANHNIIVVDNASSDNTVSQIRQYHPHITLITNQQNLGFAAGCNIGIQQAMAAQADYVLLLNNDTIVPPNLLENLIQQAQALPKVGMLTPTLSYIDDPTKIWFAGSQRHPLTLESVGFGPTGPRKTYKQTQQQVDYIFGTAMFLPTPVLKKTGLFDEAFFFYYEDMDICLRIQKAGYKLYVVHQTTVQHGIAASTQAFSTMHAYHKARGSVLFFRKHTNIWQKLFIIIPYRTASAIRTILRLSSQKQWPSIQTYVQGLRDGLRAPIDRS